MLQPQTKVAEEPSEVTKIVPRKGDTLIGAGALSAIRFVKHTAYDIPDRGRVSYSRAERFVASAIISDGTVKEGAVVFNYP